MAGRRAAVGFVVSGAVGNAVTRNRVKRRLRHLAAAQLPDTPAGVDLVVRALPRAATTPAEVPTDLGSAWHEAVSRLTAAGLTRTAVRDEVRADRPAQGCTGW